MSFDIDNSSPFGPFDLPILMAEFTTREDDPTPIPNNDFTRELLDHLTQKIAQNILAMQKDLKLKNLPKAVGEDCYHPLYQAGIIMSSSEMFLEYMNRIGPLFASSMGHHLLANEASILDMFKVKEQKVEPLTLSVESEKSIVDYTQAEIMRDAKRIARYIVSKLLSQGKAFAEKYKKASSSDGALWIKPKIRVLHVNGISTSLTEAQEHGRMISEMLNGRSVRVVHSYTHVVKRPPWVDVHPMEIYIRASQIFMDLFTAASANRGYSTDGVRKIKAEIIRFYFESQQQDKLLIIAHSRGAIETRTALLSGLPKPMLDKVMTLNVAPGAFIEKGACKDSKHLVSSLDVVPMLAIQDKSKADVTELEGQSWTMEDHSFASPIYKEELEKRLKKIRSKYESFD